MGAVIVLAHKQGQSRYSRPQTGPTDLRNAQQGGAFHRLGTGPVLGGLLSAGLSQTRPSYQDHGDAIDAHRNVCLKPYENQSLRWCFLKGVTGQ